jgi:hypothetical protein
LSINSRSTFRPRIPDQKHPLKTIVVTAGVWWIVASAGMSGAKAWTCSGDACGDVIFKFDGCYITENRGQKNISISQGPFSFDLKPREKHTIQFENRCTTYYSGQETANYICDPKTYNDLGRPITMPNKGC